MIIVFSNMGRAMGEMFGQMLREGNRLGRRGGGATEQEHVGLGPQTGDVLHGIVIEPGQSTKSRVRSPYAGFDDRASER